LEEIAMESMNLKVHGGKTSSLIPCLNDGDDWCKTVGNWISNGRTHSSSTVKVDSEKINA
jgi:ferrochelatase